MDCDKVSSIMRGAAVIFLAAAAAGFAGGVLYVDVDAVGGNDGSSWDNAYNHLQDALGDAGSLAKPVEIRVAQGVYRPDESAAEPNGSGDRTAAFQLINGVTIMGGYAGYGEADPNARDIVAYETILSGDLDANDPELGALTWENVDDFIRSPGRLENSYTVVIGSGTDSIAVLDGFTVSGGHSDGPVLGECPDVDYRHSTGGGMYNDQGSPTITHCTFHRNVAESLSYYGESYNCCCGYPPGSNLLPGTAGGGMCNRDAGPIVSDCNFVENIVYGADQFSTGGGMFNINSSTVLSNCVFVRNVATGFDNEYAGGGLYNQSSNVEMTGCRFTENTTFHSGPGGVAIAFGGNAVLTGCRIEDNLTGGMSISESNPVLNDCTFHGNSGGGLKVGGYSQVILTDCTFNANSNNQGGGMSLSDNSEAVLTGCSFVGNTADGGGGLRNYYGATATLVGCEFFGNSASYAGGAILNRVAELTAVNCIFSGNEADGETESDGGGAIHNDESEAAIVNCTFAGNSAWHGRALTCWLEGVDESCKLQAANCIFRDGGGEVWAAEGAEIQITYSNIEGSWPGAGNIDSDPLFADADGPDDIVGTADDDLLLIAGSPSIDTGDNASVPAWIETDFTGRVRIMNGIVDMGAHELQTHIYVDGTNGDDLNDGLTPETAFATIQKGMDAALTGYTVLVYPGVYSPAEGINFFGKAITVRSIGDAAILEAPEDYAVSFHNIEGPGSVLKNFVIRNSFVGIFMAGPGVSPTIKNVTVVGNEFGAAAYANANPDITNCIFWDNADGDLFQCQAQYSWIQEEMESEPIEGLICHWMLDEGQGKTACDSAGDSDMQIWWNQWADGVIGGALEFDGRSYAQADDRPAQQILTNQMTLSVWIKLGPDLGSAEGRIICKEVTPENAWSLAVYGDGYSGSVGNNVVFHDSDGADFGYDCVSATNLNPNQWYHICVTDVGGSIKIYLNGRLDTSSNDGYGIPSNIPAPIRVGWINYGSYFHGLMDDVRIYSRQLGESEVLQLYDNAKWGYGAGADPLLANPSGGDYHLRSQRGRYWPEHDLWVLDDVTSPCVDAGDPNDTAVGERTPNGGRVNIGAYGGSFYASMSECWSAADYNCDGVVNMIDIAVVAEEWLQVREWTE